MRHIVITVLVIASLSFALTGRSVAAPPPVSLELVTEPGFPITGPQEWIEVLKRVGAENIRIRAAVAGDRASVETRGTAAAPSYHVTGILTAQGRLQLPGGSFTLNDRARIAAWLEKLQQGGGQSLTAGTAAFGLTNKQLLAVHELVSIKVAQSTADRRVGDVVQEISRSLPLPISIDPGAQRALSGNETVSDELVGLTSGTALAAALRPLGLVLSVRSVGGRPELFIADVRSVQESWPIGWPAEKPPNQLVPEFFKFLNVEIEDTPLSEAIGAVQQRVKIPFLYDHNSLARQRLDPNTMVVSLPKGNTYYKKIVDRLLAPNLKSELRVDEVGQPFVWISPVRQ